MLALILSIILLKAHSVETWLCTSQASKVQGSSILACGVGLGKDEEQARAKAFDAAKAEFDRICQASSTCKDRPFTLEPKRTTCDQDGGGWKCYRLLAYSISETGPSISGKPSINPKIKKGMTKKEVITQFGVPDNMSEYKDILVLSYRNKTLCNREWDRCVVHFQDGKTTDWENFKLALTDDLD